MGALGSFQSDTQGFAALRPGLSNPAPLGLCRAALPEQNAIQSGGEGRVLMAVDLREVAVKTQPRARISHEAAPSSR